MPGRFTSDTNSRCLLVSRSIWTTTMVDTCYPVVELTGTASVLGIASFSSSGGNFAAAAPRATDGIILNQTVASGIDNVLTFDVTELEESDEEGVLVTVLETIDNVPYVIGGGRLRQGKDQQINFRATGNNIQVVLNGPYTNLTLAEVCTRYARSTAQTYLVEVCDESKDRYRFGFNGQEKVNELKGVGNSLDFGARIYDSRVARWLSLDPLAAKYPSQNPYNFALNSPIAFRDPDGKDAVVSIKGSIITITMTNYLYAVDAKTTKNYVKQYTNFYESQKANLSKKVNIDGKEYTVDIVMKFKEGTKADKDRIGMGAAFGRRTGENTMEISQNEGTPGAWREQFKFYDEKGSDGKTWRAADNNNAVFHDLFHLLGFIDRYSDTKSADGTRTASVDDPNWRDDVMSNEGLYDSKDFDPVDEHFKDIGAFILKDLPEGGVLHIKEIGDLPESERTLPQETKPQVAPEKP